MKDSSNYERRFILPLKLNPNSPSYLASTLTVALLNGGYKVSKNKFVQLDFTRDQKEDAFVFVMEEFEQLELPLKQELNNDKYRLKQFIFNSLRRFDRMKQKEGRKLEQLISENDLSFKMNGKTRFIPYPKNYERLYFGIECLSPESRAVLESYFFEGATIRIIAAQEGLSPQAVFKRLKNALRELRQILNTSGMIAQNSLSEAQVINSLFEAK